jgi:hypothetical protein
MNTIELKLDEKQLNRRFNKLHRKLDKILTILEDWDAPIMKAREGIADMGEITRYYYKLFSLDRKLSHEALRRVLLKEQGWISSDERLPNDAWRDVEVKDRGVSVLAYNHAEWMNPNDGAENRASTKGTYWREL